MAAMNGAYRVHVEIPRPGSIEVGLRFRSRVEESDYGVHASIAGLADAIETALARCGRINALIWEYRRYRPTARKVTDLHDELKTLRARLGDARVWLSQWPYNVPMMVGNPAIDQTLDVIRAIEMIGFIVLASMDDGWNHWGRLTEADGEEILPERLASAEADILSLYERPVGEVLS